MVRIVTRAGREGALNSQLVRREWFLGFSLASVAVFALGGEALFAHLP
jgi:hypothetical protein